MTTHPSNLQTRATSAERLPMRLRALILAPFTALSLTLIACDEAYDQAELSETEALMSASELSLEELDLDTLALNTSDRAEAEAVCHPSRLIARGRAHRARHLSDEMRDDALNHLDPEDEGPERDQERAQEGDSEARRSGSRAGNRSVRRHMRRRFHSKLISLAYDIDQDGELSEAERERLSDDLVAGCEAQRLRILEEFDLDEDGALSEGEIAEARELLKERREAIRTARDEAREARRASLIAEFDIDEDGALSREERREARDEHHERRRARLIAEFDADGDGELSDAELSDLTMTIRGRVRSGQRPRRVAPPMEESAEGESGDE